MENHEKHLEDLHEIRSLMERSARFISLSGLSGISAGIFALIGAYLAWERSDYNYRLHQGWRFDISPVEFYIADALAVLTLSLAVGVFFTTRNARRKGQKIWDRTSRYLLINLAIPLLTGGIFCLILLFSAVYLIPSATLIFYGLSLLNASKFTLPDIRYLGICEIIIGLLCGFLPEYGLLFWAIGFGILHIVYGTVMYFKYER